MSGTIYLLPEGGLCNRLRLIISYKYLYPNNDINVCWESSVYCNGFFLDYFEPIEKITFEKEINKNILISKDNKDILNKNLFLDKKYILSCSAPRIYWSEYKMLKFLKPKKKILNKIEKILEKISKNFIAVHIRRTDASHKINDTCSNDAFFDFIDKSNYNLYIATDCYETQKIFYKKYSNRIPHIGLINPKNEFNINYYKNKQKKYIRQTTLEDAIIDLWICSYSTYFKGSPSSSFTQFIKKLIKFNKN